MSQSSVTVATHAHAAYKEPGSLANLSQSQEWLDSPTLNDEEDVSQFRR